MAEGRSPRKLAAVLAADVAGYSRLMQQDDRATLRALTESRTLFTECATSHGGRVINAPGDSILVEFVSVIGALECAVELQQALAERNAALEQSRRMLFRIGVNLGDVLVDDSGIYGDGVNVAARLEGLAEPGGICISGSVHEQVQGKLDLQFDDMGDQQVKNISRPVRAYRLRVGIGAPETPALAVTTTRPPLSIVVLPFANLSDDPEQGYLADAITEDLTTDLSRIAGSFVIARNSAFTYKGKAVDVKQVGRDLGVQYALEGSVRRAGNRIRINAQLVETETGTHIWADRLDREMGDMLALQDDITGSIARVLRYELIQAESRRSVRERPANPQAIDYAMRARAIGNRDALGNRDQSRAAQRLYEEALKLDPLLPIALTGLAVAWLTEVQFGWTEDAASALQKADILIARAESVAANEARVMQCRGIWLQLCGKPALALLKLEEASARDPNSLYILQNIGWVKMFLGDPQGALAQLQQALRLDPRDRGRANTYSTMGTANLYLGNDEEAIRYLRLCIEEHPAKIHARMFLAAACAHAGRLEEAHAALDEFRHMRPGVGIAKLRSEALSTVPRYLKLRERLYDGLRLAGFEE